MNGVSAPDRVRYVSAVVGLVLVVMPDQLFEEYPARRDPAVVAVGGEPVAVTERAVMHDDPAAAAPGSRREMCGVTTFEMNDRRHDAPPPTTSATKDGRPCDPEDTKVSRHFKRQSLSCRPSLSERASNVESCVRGGTAAARA